MQDAQQAGELTAEQADAAKERYAKIHHHFVVAMAREKALLDQAKSLNEQLLVSVPVTACSHLHASRDCQNTNLSVWMCLHVA